MNNNNHVSHISESPGSWLISTGSTDRFRFKLWVQLGLSSCLRLYVYYSWGPGSTHGDRGNSSPTDKHILCYCSTVFITPANLLWGFRGGLDGKESACTAGDLPGSRISLEKGMETHSSILAWRIPWTEEPGWLQSIGLQSVRHN